MPPLPGLCVQVGFFSLFLSNKNLKKKKNQCKQQVVINSIHLCSRGFCSRIAIAFQANLRQSYRNSIYITAQCIETQIMLNESSVKDLYIMSSHVRPITLSWRNLHHKESTWVKGFLLYSFFLLSASHLLVNDWSTIPEKLAHKILMKLHMGTYR